ncbi:monovalent cation/H(+) antiporter subunit G [Accumulibacter sp.]|uniref:monovalent cation/H(+) antiporter subunit G n=1 Tax=Accumulibacter sp. TaxID=2053492 RepID=UPI0025E8E688|nr:monovalent cation/H(+) antiporter subunit G [Accumulibacter sp.]MCM8611606.1 monovalent cation/H(+) antiporter subunit G [Accumulibacter sp.]MCM8635371.1 monovalent cation/H(+) antiporter subunit G [Accumulibacter sp.]MCM8638976.1 monovalent cation/H(+) antiporter subunit G [Accumulibacter sp.]
MTYAGSLLLALGALLLLLASIGLFSLRDSLSRQHAATKAGSLAVACIVLGAALLAGDAAWIGRAFAIIAIVWLTLPVASHVLARAALREQAETIDRERLPLFEGDDRAA